MAKKGKYEKTQTSAAKRAANKAAVKSRKKKGSGAVVAAVGVSLLLVVVLAVYGVGLGLVKSDTIFPNVRVAGVEVGGLTARAAQGEVEAAVADAYGSHTLEVRLPDKTLAFEPEQTKVVLDCEEAIEEAMAFGRSDGPI